MSQAQTRITRRPGHHNIWRAGPYSARSWLLRADFWCPFNMGTPNTKDAYQSLQKTQLASIHSCFYQQTKPKHPFDAFQINHTPHFWILSNLHHHCSWLSPPKTPISAESGPAPNSFHPCLCVNSWPPWLLRRYSDQEASNKLRTKTTHNDEAIIAYHRINDPRT